MTTERRTTQTQTDYQVAADSPLATTRLKQKKSRNWLPFFGIVLILAGVIFFAATSGIAGAKFLVGLWPLFALIAGVAAVMGFAVERKPRSPVGGMLLLFVGTLFSVARFDSGLNPIQVYGRYWILLLAIFAAVELVRYYTHRESEGRPPKLFGVGRLFIITLIVGTGVVANRAAMNGSFLGTLPLGGFLGNLRDSVIGENFTFTDEPIALANLKPGSRLIINNPYGNVKVEGAKTTARATLSQGVRAWNQETAKQIADKINLNVSETGAGEYTITTNREEVKETVNRQFNTDIQIEVPSSVTITVINSYGTVAASKVGGLAVTSKYGRVEANDISGNLSFTLTATDVNASNVLGNVAITGGDEVRLNKITGNVEVAGKNGSVDLREVSGEVKVDAPHSRITAQDLAQNAVLKTEHSRVNVTKAAGVTVDAPYSDVIASNINGDLKIETSHSDVELKSISGNVVIIAEQTQVRVNEIQGTASISTSHGNVEVKNFHEGLNIQTSYRDVSLSASGELTGDVIVENSHGDIKAVIAQGTNFKVDAESDNGRVKLVGFGESPNRDRESFAYSSGTGAPVIKLRTSYKTITVQALGLRQAIQPPPPPPPPAGLRPGPNLPVERPAGVPDKQ